VEHPDAGPVRLLTRSEVRGLLRWPELIEAAERALVAIATGDPVAATSDQLRVPGASLHLKSGALGSQMLSVKANLRPDAGSSAGVVLAFDPARFALRAILDSADITAMRTAAIAAVAARRLAGPGDHIVAVIGAGPVGRESLAALRRVLPVSGARLWSRTRPAADELAAVLPGPVEVCRSAAEAATGADIIVTATPSREPLLQAADIAPGTLVLAMGADSVGKRELGPGALQDATVVADVLANALVAGECAYLPADSDRASCVELGDVLAGRRDLPGPPSGRIIFDSVGSAVVDAAVTGLVVALAERDGVGTSFTFDD
jgi:ornithine cyclodeaminase/alanine dehydrogenase-like protein (mu-crystallin family)